MTAQEWRRSLRLLDDYMVRLNLTGPDPYDGLSGWLPMHSTPRRVRQAVVQGVKRSPVDVRPLLGIRPVRMTKTLALVAQGLSVADWLPRAEERRIAILDEIVTRLDERGGWGYEFDVQTRWGFYPAGSPNIIATAFAVEALSTSRPHLDSVRERVAGWLLDEMLCDGFVRYVPGFPTLIHNASLLGARALHRISPGHPVVAEALERSVSLQRPDGTWPYGERDGLEWIDGFHTAYVLAALAVLAEDLDDAKARFALETGADAFAVHFFPPDDRPHYFIDRAGPADIHNIATCIQVLSELASVMPGMPELVPRAVAHLLTLQGIDGAFRARRGARPYMRWNQAHTFLALAEVTQSRGQETK